VTLPPGPRKMKASLQSKLGHKIEKFLSPKGVLTSVASLDDNDVLVASRQKLMLRRPHFSVLPSVSFLGFDPASVQD
jgi:hypothetical protein